MQKAKKKRLVATGSQAGKASPRGDAGMNGAFSGSRGFV